MALVLCKECRKQISSKAKICPACGVKSPAPLDRKGCLQLLGIVVIFIFLANGIFSQGSKSAEKRSQQLAAIVEEKGATEVIKTAQTQLAVLSDGVIGGQTCKAAYDSNMDNRSLEVKYVVKTCRGVKKKVVDSIAAVALCQITVKHNYGVDFEYNEHTLIVPYDTGATYTLRVVLGDVLPSVGMVRAGCDIKDGEIASNYLKRNRVNNSPEIKLEYKMVQAYEG